MNNEAIDLFDIQMVAIFVAILALLLFCTWLLFNNSYLKKKLKGSQSEVDTLKGDVINAQDEKISVSLSEKLIRNLTSEIPGYVFLFSATKEGVFKFDFISEGVWRLNGVSVEEVQQDVKSFFRYVQQEDVDAFKSILKKKLVTKESIREEFRVNIPTKKQRWLLLESHFQEDSSGKLQWSGMVSDITEQKQTQSDLHLARMKAEEATRAKSMFLAAMSHEIRTPMNGIIGSADMLTMTDVDEDQKELINIILSSGESLLALINDILDLSKIEAEKMKLDQQAFDLKQLIKDASKLVSLKMQAKGLEFSGHYSSDLPTYFIGDRNRIRQILLNLLSNAVKFTDDGFVRLRVHPNFEPMFKGDKMLLKIEVEDSGMGIAEEDINRLFMEFVQVGKNTEKHKGGTGLGLAITEKLVNAMGGNIFVASEKGKGSTFTFIIPLTVADEEELPSYIKSVKNNDDRSLGSKDNFSILVVDDNAVNRKITGLTLEKLGHNCMHATNGEEALDLYREHEYDLIFMDIVMPGLDGVEVTRIIRKLENDLNRKRAFIVALTANAFAEDRRQYLSAGMDSYLSKPFKKEDIVKVLELAIDR